MWSRAALALAALTFAALLASAVPSRADPVPRITPFEGLWVGKGETCPDELDSANGDEMLIQGRSIGGGDTACTLDDMTVRGTIHYFRMYCHGVNRSFLGKRHIRIDVLGPDRILYRNQGAEPSEMVRCKKK